MFNFKIILRYPGIYYASLRIFIVNGKSLARWPAATIDKKYASAFCKHASITRYDKRHGIA